ncbi:MAG: ATP synthase F1 subunit delta [Candidatus Aminicenantaceae bacterium]
MRNQILIKRYTQGLVNTIEREEEFSTLRKELSDFTSFLFSHKQLKEILSKPFLPSNKKIDIIKEILTREKLSKKASNFIIVLTENKRIDLLPEILDLLPLLWNEKKGVETYEVTSAVPLDELQKKKLEKKLESLEKRQVVLKYKIDPELIGGLSIKKGNIIYDISLKGALSKMKEKIIES